MRLFLAITGLLGFSFSQALVLGELKGQGLFSSTQTVEDYKSEYSNNPCNLAYNIVDSAKSFGVSFAAVVCNGMDIWNEAYVLEVRGEELFVKNTKVGSLVNGTGEFTLKSSTSGKIQNVRYNIDCQVSHFETKTVKLNNSLTYKIQKRGEQHYKLTRTQSYDYIASTAKKPYPNCPSHIVDVVGKRQTLLEGEVKP